MIIKYSVGLDVSSKDIKLCITSIDFSQDVKVLSRLTILNTKAGFSQAVVWMSKWQKDKNIPLVVCMEATGIYHENCAYFLYDKGYSVSVVLPNKSKKYLQAFSLLSGSPSAEVFQFSYPTIVYPLSKVSLINKCVLMAFSKSI